MNLKEELKKLKELLKQKREEKKISKIDKEELDYVSSKLSDERLNDVDSLYEYLKTANFNENTEPGPHAKALAQQFQDKTVILENRIERFLNWCDKVMEENPKDMRKFIEKMAVWYELRYPDYEINRMIPCTGQESVNVSEEMFDKNAYINMFFDENSDIRCLDWNDFYNANVFINSLPYGEKRFLKNPKFYNIVDFKDWRVHLHLSKEGVVEGADELRLLERKYTKKFDLEKIVGKNVRDVIDYFKSEGIASEEIEPIEEVIRYYDNRVYQKEEMLNCVMCYIIERGGNRIGPRRAFLFAKEFKRDIDIPMMYGVDLTDPGLRDFVNEYLKAGGTEKLVCYVRSATNEIIYKDLNTITIEEILKTRTNKIFFTQEEKHLQQDLVNLLTFHTNKKELEIEQKKEEAKQKRIQRKLEKSRNVK